MAGSVAELARYSLRRDFRRIDPTKARIILVEASPRILGAFPEDLSNYALAALDHLGVTVRTGTAVETIESGRVTMGGEVVRAGCIVWGAGVKAAPVAAWLSVEADKTGRVSVEPDLSVTGLDGIYVIGDGARALDGDGQPLPALAQVAQQQGQYLGKALARAIRDGTPMPPFRFHNRGNTAVIGRDAAVFDFGRWRFKGRIGWLLWAIVHIYLLTGFDKRVLVATQWLWRYLTYQTGARLITGHDDRESRSH